MRISLRGQLTLWYALVIPVLVFGLAFTAQEIMVYSLRESLDDKLQERAVITASAIAEIAEDTGQTYEEVMGQLTEDDLPFVPLLLRVTDLERNILTTLGDVPHQLLPYLGRQLDSQASDEGLFGTVSVEGIEAIRVYTGPMNDPSTSEAFALIQTGDSLPEVGAARSRLWRYTVIAGVVGSLLALLVGLLILRRGFRPLDRILERVQHVESSSLRVGLGPEPRPPELQQLADSLNTMWRRLDEAIKARETFVASTSHDLRTPLTILQGQMDVLLMQPSLDPETRQSLETMNKEVRRLVKLTNNLLLSAQLQSGPSLAAKEVSLRGIVEEVVGDISTSAAHLNVGLSADEDVVVAGDQDLLKQAVLNVADNAVKFTPKGGWVQLSLERKDDWAIIQVSDTGQGIPAKDLRHVMEPFYRPDASTRTERGGTGLGLAIAKQVAELHGGEVLIQSQVGVGTTVKIVLPIAATGAELPDGHWFG